MAVWAVPGLETCVGVVGALLGGAAMVPVNPKIGQREIAHLLTDSSPSVVLAPREAELPRALGDLPRLAADLGAPRGRVPPPSRALRLVAFIFYTSGTTGPPKGVLIPRRAVASNLDALAEAWAWTRDDVLTHGLPLFHVHGLVLGVLGPLRTGGTLRYAGRFSVEGIVREIAGGGDHAVRGADHVPRAGRCGRGAIPGRPGPGPARLMVSGSAALPLREHSHRAGLGPAGPGALRADRDADELRRPGRR